MPASGVLSLRKYFPKADDVLDSLEDEISWECVRGHTYVDGKTGARVRYVLLVGRHESLGDKPIPRLVDDATSLEDFMKTVDLIHRRVDDRVVTYRRNAKGNYEEE